MTVLVAVLDESWLSIFMNFYPSSLSTEATECFWDSVCNSVGFGIYVIEAGDCLELVFINPICVHLFEVDPNSLEAAATDGKKPLDCLFQCLACPLIELLQQCIETGQAVEVECQTTGTSGRRWLLHHIMPQRNSQGQVDRVVGSCCDISRYKHTENTLRNLMLATTAATGENLFPAIVEHLAIALRVDYVLLSRRVENNLHIVASSSALPFRNRCLTGTPCEIVIRQGEYYHPAGVQSCFHADDGLRHLKVEGYYGVCLRSSAGKVFGHLCILHTHPLTNLEVYQPLLQSFARRLAAELERCQAEADLRASEECYRLLAENMTDLVCLHEADGRFIYVSPSSLALLGYAPGELVGTHPYSFIHPEDSDRLYQSTHLWEGMSQALPTLYRFRAKSGTYIWLETLTQPILDNQNRVVKLQTTSRAVTERVYAEEQLRYQALHDELTGLPNRNLLNERLERAIRRFAQQPEKRYAVFFLDLDQFKVINDTLGHLAGDQLLMNVAQKLQMLVRDGDVAARLGGDEFVILLEQIDSLSTAFRIAERIRDELQLPQWIGDRQVPISTSIGIVFGSYAHQSAADLLRDADIAMYRAKAQGGGRYEVFDPMMGLRAVERLSLENDLRRAIALGEIVLYFQPIVSLTSGRIYGFEALVRWQHHQRGLILPQDFIPVAEEIGTIVPLSNWILEQACCQMVQWQQAIPHARHLMLSVNLATQQFRQPNFVQQVNHILQTTGLAGENLILEFREAMLISDLRPLVARLEALRSLAIQLSLDDFGTGYFSLGHLHQLPLNMLKIAQTFIGAVPSSSREDPVASMVVALAQQLDLVVVAEGIESVSQLQRLAELGCELGQGYCFAAPLAASEVPSLLATVQSYEMNLG